MKASEKRVSDYIWDTWSHNSYDFWWSFIFTVFVDIDDDVGNSSKRNDDKKIMCSPVLSVWVWETTSCLLVGWILFVKEGLDFVLYHQGHDKAYLPKYVGERSHLLNALLKVSLIWSCNKTFVSLTFYYGIRIGYW